MLTIIDSMVEIMTTAVDLVLHNVVVGVIIILIGLYMYVDRKPKARKK